MVRGKETTSKGQSGAWEMPVDTRLYATSAAFGGGHVWERGTPLG